MSAAAAEGAAAPLPRKQVQPWEQRPGENDLWYARFLRFVAIGPTGPVGPRSISLVSTGEKNHYPVPAHWPMVAKQRQWRERAAAFDEAARRDEAVISQLNALVVAAQLALDPVRYRGDVAKLQGVEYIRPTDEETE